MLGIFQLTSDNFDRDYLRYEYNYFWISMDINNKM